MKSIRYAWLIRFFGVALWVVLFVMLAVISVGLGSAVFGTAFGATRNGLQLVIGGVQ